MASCGFYLLSGTRKGHGWRGNEEQGPEVVCDGEGAQAHWPLAGMWGLSQLSDVQSGERGIRLVLDQLKERRYFITWGPGLLAR